VLSCLRPTLKKLPDLERAVTRAFHGTIRPADFAAMLQQFSRLHQQLGVAADLLAAAGGPSSAAATGGSSGSGTAAAPPPPPVNLQGVQSELLQQLLRAAADLSVPAAAEQLLGSMDLQAASANDKGNLLRWAGGRGRTRLPSRMPHPAPLAGLSCLPKKNVTPHACFALPRLPTGTARAFPRFCVGAGSWQLGS
jgi:hypothetical protein